MRVESPVLPLYPPPFPSMYRGSELDDFQCTDQWLTFRGTGAVYASERAWILVSNSKMAESMESEKPEKRGSKRPLVEDYSDDDEEEEKKRVIGNEKHLQSYF